MNARTYTVKLRSGEIKKVTVKKNKSIKPPLPYSISGKEVASIQWAKTLKLPRGVVGGCEFFRKYEDCEDNATHQVTVCSASGTKVPYLVCGSCKERFLDDLTPLCNTGSKSELDEG